MSNTLQTKPTIYVLVGPTAVGKTDLSIQLAKKMGAEIISADSMQIYRELTIGSAKPTVEEMQGVPHHMLGILPVSEVGFSAARFQEMAMACISDILSRGKQPFLVGGTGLYVHGLTHPLGFTQVPGNPEVRARLQGEEAAAPGALYKRLQQVDIQSAGKLHPNDIRRIVRALEVYEVSGRTISSFGADFTNAQQAETTYSPVIAGLSMERSKLYERINLRVDSMLQNGLLEETTALLQYDRALPALQGLGYKQLLRYLDGEVDYAAAIEDIKRETRRFAKRQWTWFKRDPRIRWFDCTDAAPQSLSEDILAYFKAPHGAGKE